MTITCRDSKIRALGRNFGTAIGVLAVAATVPLEVAATANADSVDRAIDAATVPITTAQAAIDAVPTATLSPVDLAILNGQDAFLSTQETILGQLETFQDSLISADQVADQAGNLSLIDNLLVEPPDYAVQYATTAYIDSLDGSFSDQLSSLGNLVYADLLALNGDLNAFALSGLVSLSDLGFGFGSSGFPDIPIPGL